MAFLPLDSAEVPAQLSVLVPAVPGLAPGLAPGREPGREPGLEAGLEPAPVSVPEPDLGPFTCRLLPSHCSMMEGLHLALPRLCLDYLAVDYGFAVLGSSLRPRVHPKGCC